MRFSSAVLCGLASVLLASTRVAASGGGEFAINGAPTMTVIAGLVFVALSIYKGISHGGSDFTASASNLGGSYLLLNFLNVVFRSESRGGSARCALLTLICASADSLAFCLPSLSSVFMLFGPSPTLGPRVSILGFQILMGCCIGFYATYTNHKAATWALFVYNLVCALCIVGSMPLMNFSSPLFAVEPTGCLSYYDNTDPNYNRCWDLVRITHTHARSRLASSSSIGEAAVCVMTLRTRASSVSACRLSLAVCCSGLPSTPPRVRHVFALHSGAADGHGVPGSDGCQRKERRWRAADGTRVRRAAGSGQHVRRACSGACGRSTGGTRGNRAGLPSAVSDVDRPFSRLGEVRVPPSPCSHNDQRLVHSHCDSGSNHAHTF